MGLRLILLLAAIWFIINLLRKERHQPKAVPPRRHDAGRMVRCEHCGLYVPEGEALTADGHHYCCEDHRRLRSQHQGS